MTAQNETATGTRVQPLVIKQVKVMPQTDRPTYGKVRVYFWPEGETVVENAVHGRWTRPHRLYRRHLPAVYQAAGIPQGVKANWNQRAGCECGCSPGFILEHRATFDVHVTVAWTGPATDPAQ
jgi:hypothetical protein